MNKTPEQEANDLVDMFYNEIYDTERDMVQCAVECAILHVEMLVAILQLHDTWDAVTPHYEQVLQILKDKK